MPESPVPSALASLFAVAADTVREAFARRIVWAIYGSTLFILMFLLFVLEIDIISGAKATISLFGQEAMSTESAEMLDSFVRQVQGAIAVFLFAVSTFVAVFVCAGLTPALFESGRVELLLARPVPRAAILLGRYVGNAAMVGLNVVLLVGLSYFILGVKSGFWYPGFLYAIPLTFFTFCVLMAIVMLVSVWSESPAVAVIVTFLAILFSPVLAQRDLAIRLLGSEFSRGIWNAMYQVTPKVYELGALIIRKLRGLPVESWSPLLSSAILGLVCLLAALVVFERKDH